ncbi:hypothetical protein ALC60_12238 [Trachymyrmex zeteki]|uniref:Uncharacterized protein n=1 Tax=Mycetomoellerius zeteki TaxID=64791 RepID=A0A151WLG9_9HYME|nr:hypothetical protein ALC60_12238 [Trachymyrmex zeteki]
MTANRLQQISAVVSAVVVDFEINFTGLWRASETYRADVSVRKVRRHYTGTVSICTSDHLSEYLMVPLDFVEVGTSRDLSPRVIVFSDERSRNGFCVTTYLRCDTSTVEIKLMIRATSFFFYDVCDREVCRHLSTPYSRVHACGAFYSDRGNL